MLVKCNCTVCSEHLEFEPENAGSLIKCPHCGMETVLFIPQAKSKPKPEPLPKAEPPKSPEPKIAAKQTETKPVATFFTSRQVFVLLLGLFAVGIAGGFYGAKLAQPKAWEYNITWIGKMPSYVNGSARVHEHEIDMDSDGNSGWEFVTFVPAQDGDLYAVFKRPCASKAFDVMAAEREKAQHDANVEWNEELKRKYPAANQ
jgi:DNA-directed RNA polymerase subunit RPC12/RpoP